MISDPAQPSPEGGYDSDLFKQWQTRTLLATIFGYAAFYFIRKNLSMAMPGIEADLHITKKDLGLFLTLHGLFYGFSKYFNGIWGDRSDARVFMVAGLLICVVSNVFFGLGSTVLWLGIAWVLNGWFQGMGNPPCMRLITHWFHPKELATKGTMWNTSHSIGACAALVFCGYIAAHYSWRWAFFAPAALCTVAAIILWVFLRDTPSSVGLPEIQVGDEKFDVHEDKKSPEYKKFVMERVYLNPTMWILSMAGFFLYVLRLALLDWGPTLLKESKGYSIQNAGWMVGGFELAGLAGMLVSGWITDKLFKGRGARTSAIYMILATLCVFAFQKATSPIVATATLVASGFFIYGPQALIGIVMCNMVTRRAAATAIGFGSIFGYSSSIFSGWLLGSIVHSHGWDAGYLMLYIAGALGTLMCVLCWNLKAHSYE